MHRKTVKAPKVDDKIWGLGESVLFQKSKSSPRVEKETVALGTIVPKMGFWNRLKYFLTGKVGKKNKNGPIAPPPVFPSEIDFAMETKPEYSASYTTFSGHDIKAVLTFGLGDNPTKEELLYAAHPSWGAKGLIDAVTHAANYKKSHSTSIPELQGISAKTICQENSEQPKTAGSLICIMFDQSVIKRIEELEKKEGALHLVLLAATEYGDVSFFALPNFKITSWSWGISTDDLVSEEVLEFEADEPRHWEWVPRFSIKPKETK